MTLEKERINWMSQLKLKGGKGWVVSIIVGAVTLETPAAAPWGSSVYVTPLRVITGSDWLQRPQCSQGIVSASSHNPQANSRKPELNLYTPLLDFLIPFLYRNQNNLLWSNQALYPSFIDRSWSITCSITLSLILPLRQDSAICIILLTLQSHLSSKKTNNLLIIILQHY